MAGNDNDLSYRSLAPDSGNLDSLDAYHRSGLTAVAFFACLSLISCTTLWSYLTWKIIVWCTKIRGAATEDEKSAAPNAVPAGTGVILGAAPEHFPDSCLRPTATQASTCRKPHLNQFLVLAYNLLLADIHQSIAFLLNGVWAAQNSITVGNPACFIQGLFLSTGDLASSLFIAAIAVHTYVGVVFRYRPPQWAVTGSVVGIWVFDYGLAVLGPLITRNGRGDGGFYVRASAWCWVNIKYENYRLVLHYLYIFVALAMTCILYSIIFFTLRRREMAQRALQQWSRCHGPREVIVNAAQQYRSFLLYPVIYLICTAPVAIGRAAAMAGVDVPISFYLVSGTLIASNGWLDVLLWSFTRQKLIFEAEVDSQETGLGTFTFMRTPPDRNFGNMVWVEGGVHSDPCKNQLSAQDERLKSKPRDWRRLVPLTPRKTVSNESLRRTAEMQQHETGIHLDSVTTIELDSDKGSKMMTEMKMQKGKAWPMETTLEDDEPSINEPERVVLNRV